MALYRLCGTVLYDAGMLGSAILMVDELQYIIDSKLAEDDEGASGTFWFRERAEQYYF